ncbi:MAG: DUF3108 domain-containing protein [Xanthobacteraceae bacterium]
MGFRFAESLRTSLIAVSGAAAVMLGVATAPAGAQAKLEAKYTASLAGLPIGKGTWVLDIDEGSYNGLMSGGTTGLIKLFSSGQGASSVRGTWSDGRSLASTYSSQIKTKRKTDQVDVTLEGGKVKDFRVSPPIDADPERVPITDAEKRGVIDPMTGSMLYVAGNGEMLSSSNCRRTLPLFDGRFRYNLKLAFKRMDTVRADKGYAGPVVVCSVMFAPVAGFIPDRKAIEYLVAMRDAEVWLAPVQGTRVLVPFRVDVPTPFGSGSLEASQFIVTPKPVQAAIKNGKVR